MGPRWCPCSRTRKRTERLHQGAREESVDTTWGYLTDWDWGDRTASGVPFPSMRLSGGRDGRLAAASHLRGGCELPTAAGDGFEVVVGLVDRQPEAELCPTGRPRLGP